MLAFLASFENYNTTTFTFGEYPTLTIELAQKVRYGITPAISALAFIIVALTVFFALMNEAKLKRQELVAAARKNATVEELAGKIKLPSFFAGNMAAVLLVVFAVATITVVGTAATYNPAQCIADIRAQKQLEAEQRIQELRKQREERRKQQEAQEAEQGGGQTAPKPSNNSGFGNVFAPNSLGGDENEGEDGASETETAPTGNSGFGGVFDPNTLQSDE